MKSLFTRTTLFLVLFVTCAGAAFAQAPNSTNYQAVVRNSSGTILASQPIGLQFIIHSGTATGTTVYQETWSTTSNTLGLVNVNVGQGTVVTGTFSGINWASGGPFYLEVDMDPTGGTNYVPMGTQEMLSVPYALNAATVNTVGQSLIELPCSGSLTISSTSPSFSVIPGLSTTINVTSNELVLVQTNGGFANNKASANCAINVALFVDGNLYGTPAYVTVFGETNTGSGVLYGSLWNFSQVLSLSAGSHTIAIEAEYYYMSNTSSGWAIIVGNPPGNVPTAGCIIQILKQ